MNDGRNVGAPTLKREADHPELSLPTATSIVSSEETLRPLVARTMDMRATSSAQLEGLAHLLLTLHDAHDGVSSLYIEIRDWARPPPDRRLSVDVDGVRPPKVRWSGGGPRPAPVSGHRRIWSDGPELLRIEVESGAAMVQIGVRNGDEWWTWNRVAGTVSGSDVREPEAVPSLLAPPLLAPARLLASLRFEATSRGVRAGRAVLAAQARPRPELRAEKGVSYTLEFDAQHGTLMRREAFYYGKRFALSEVVAVRYGLEIERARFELVPPDAE